MIRSAGKELKQIQDMKNYKGYLFDLNGTMINDMAYHIHAWHGILNNLGAGISLERMKEECYGKNEELLERIFPGRFSMEEKKSMGFEKEKQYQEAFRPYLEEIPGLAGFIRDAHQAGIRMAIGSAAIRFNIDFVLDGLRLRPFFDAIISADEVANSKPHPETFLKCAQQLSLRPEDCLVFEDAPKGVEAAHHAGMHAVVITTEHAPSQFASCSNVVCFIHDYKDKQLQRFIR